MFLEVTLVVMCVNMLCVSVSVPFVFILRVIIIAKLGASRKVLTVKSNYSPQLHGVETERSKLTGSEILLMIYLFVIRQKIMRKFMLQKFFRNIYL